MAAQTEISLNNQVILPNITVKKINSLLNSACTRVEGLKLLNSYLPQCSNTDFVGSCVNWMQSCCKIDGFSKHGEMAVSTLNHLFNTAANFPELNKTVSFFLTTRFFDYFLKYLVDYEFGWYCMKTCFLLFKGPCGPFQETFQKHLISQINNNSKIGTTIAQCYALLPSLGGGGNEGVNYTARWKSQSTKLIKTCHLILNILFHGFEELQDYDTSDCLIDPEGNQTDYYFLSNQIYNYCRILSSMLLNKYPAVKNISADTFLQLISRGLAFTPRNLGKHKTSDIALLDALPDIHTTFYSLLNSLIVTCKNQLLPYAHLICKIIKQTLEWTNVDLNFNAEKSSSLLRISTYKTLINWLIVTRSGSCTETISNIIITNVAADIQAKKELVTLKDSKRKISTNLKDGKIYKTPSLNSNILCQVALKALQCFLKFSGVLLKPEEHKFLQETVIKILVDIQSGLPFDLSIPYFVELSRKELYHTLLELVNNPSPKRPPPTHFALEIFSRGENDVSPIVSQFCSMGLSTLTNIIHPQFTHAGLVFSEKKLEVIEKEKQNQLLEIENEGFEILENREGGIDSNKSYLSNIARRNEMNSSEKISNPSTESNSFITKGKVSTGIIQYSENENENIDVNEVKRKEDHEFENSLKKPNESIDNDEYEPVNKKRRSSIESFTLSKAVISNDSEATSSSAKNKITKVFSIKEKHKVLEMQNLPETTQKETEKGTRGSPKTIGLVVLESECRVKNCSTETAVDEKSGDSKKRYFLRSKTYESSSEELEETMKRSSSSESMNRGLQKVSSNSESPKNRPRTRSSTKLLESLESESEIFHKKTEQDDEDEDIIEAFDDSVID